MLVWSGCILYHVELTCINFVRKNLSNTLIVEKVVTDDFALPKRLGYLNFDECVGLTVIPIFVNQASSKEILLVDWFYRVELTKRQLSQFNRNTRDRISGITIAWHRRRRSTHETALPPPLFPLPTPPVPLSPHPHPSQGWKSWGRWRVSLLPQLSGDNTATVLPPRLAGLCRPTPRNVIIIAD